MGFRSETALNLTFSFYLSFQIANQLIWRGLTMKIVISNAFILILSFKHYADLIISHFEEEEEREKD